MRKIEQIGISAADRERLERLVRDRNTPQKVVWRARIVLLASDGLTAEGIAAAVHTSLAVHYQSDLARLDGVREAGTLLSALNKEPCPLCGAPPESQRHGGGCDGDVDQVVAAADAEANNIDLLRAELQESLAQLRGEGARFDETTPRLFQDLQKTDAELDRMSPYVTGQRAAYSEIFEKRSAVQTALNFFSTIDELEQRKVAAETPPSRREEKETSSNDLSASTLDSFSGGIGANGNGIAAAKEAGLPANKSRSRAGRDAEVHPGAGVGRNPLKKRNSFPRWRR